MTRGLRLVGGITLVLVGSIIATPLPSVLSKWLSVSTPLMPAQAIVVLGGGGVRGDGELTDTSLRRTHHGIGLYHRGLAPLLVLAGGQSSRVGHSEVQARRRLARSCAVRDDAILLATRARTTRDEALEISRLLAPRGVRTILLVADTEGMSRAQRLFRGVGFDVVAAPVGDVATMGSPESQFEVMRRVTIELAAWAYYGAAGRF